MYSVSVKKDCFDIYELYDDSTDSRVSVCPERGGIIISFTSKGRELLYLDHETFKDPLKNIRGGIPILFPICGQLPDSRYRLNGQTYTMANHGVARASSWIVEDYGTEPYAYIKLSLLSNIDTLKSYPFDFKLTFTYILCKGKLTINQSLINTTCNSADINYMKMPVHTGFHPYFKVSGKLLCHNIKSYEYYDYNDMKFKLLTNPYDASNKIEASLISLSDTDNIEFYDMSVPDCKIKMDFSPEYRYLMLWFVDGCDFICVEPWTAKNQEMLRGDELIWLEPGKKLTMFIGIERV